MHRWIPVLMVLAACSNGEKEDPATDAPTWHQDIAPIVSESCAGCHTDGGIAPFSFDDYATVQELAWLIADTVEAGTMPPFFAQETGECEPPLPWKDDLRLSDEEKALFRDWADGGAPEGDAGTAAPLPEPPSVDLTSRDLRVPAGHPVTVEGDEDLFRCIVLDPGLEEDVYVDAIQVVPGNDKVVHHVLVWADPANQSAALADENGHYECFGAPLFDNTYMLSAWAPGGVPNEMPEDTGMYLRAGSKIVLNVHYHPTDDSVETDQTTVDLRFMDGTPSNRSEVILIGNFDRSYGTRGGLHEGPNDEDGIEFRIPADVSGHTETMSYKLGFGEGPVSLWSVGTHMHYVGTDMKFWVEHDDGSETCLVQTPDWDFNWQRGYAYDAPLDEVPSVGPGDRLWMRCTYDNTLDNPFVAEALAEQGLESPVDVFLGDDTLDEMCLGVMVAAYPN